MRNYPGILANFVAGKFISAVAHAVETLNWMRDFCGNLQGDADVNAQGAITVDVSDPRHPVIRLAGKLPSGGGGGGGGGAALAGCFEIDSSTGALANRYVAVGGIVHEAPAKTVSASESGVLYLRVNATGTTFTASYGYAQDMAAMIDLINADTALQYYYKPLYVIASGAAVTDLRNMPELAMGEV